MIVSHVHYGNKAKSVPIHVDFIFDIIAIFIDINQKIEKTAPKAKLQNKAKYFPEFFVGFFPVIL